jgi:hypothetical protein
MMPIGWLFRPDRTIFSLLGFHTMSMPAISSSLPSASGGKPASADHHDAAAATPPSDETTKSSAKPHADAYHAGDLSSEDLALMQKLQRIDASVRAHESAHKSVGGALAGGISYSYQTGPNGVRYAVGGEVPIDTSPVEGDPAATIAKMTRVRAAALAPADPSAADMSIASRATAQIARAHAEATKQAIADAEETAAPTREAAGRGAEGSTGLDVVA